MKKSIPSRLLFIVLSLGGWGVSTVYAELVVSMGEVGQHDSYSGTNATVYRYDGTNWVQMGGGIGDEMSAHNHSHIYALCEYDGQIYAAADGIDFSSNTTGCQVYVWNAFNNPPIWEVTGKNNSNNGIPRGLEVRALIVFQGALYAGVCPTRSDGQANKPFWKYVKDEDRWIEISGPTSPAGLEFTKFGEISNDNPGDHLMRHGIASMYAWNSCLYLGDLYQDSVVKWDPGVTYGVAPFQEEMGEHGCCIWDFAVFNHTYATGQYDGDRLFCISEMPSNSVTELTRIYARPNGGDIKTYGLGPNTVTVKKYGWNYDTAQDQSDDPYWAKIAGGTKDDFSNSDDPIYYLEVYDSKLYASVKKQVGPLVFNKPCSCIKLTAEQP